MGKSRDRKPLVMDYELGIGEIIPSKQNSDKEGEQVKIFKEKLLAAIRKDPPNKKIKGDLFVFVVQFLNSEKQYKSRDIDNIAKTLLDVLEVARVFEDDSQIRTLLICKRTSKEISINYAYFSLKEIKNDNEAKILKIAGYERAVSLYNRVAKEQKYLN